MTVYNERGMAALEVDLNQSVGCVYGELKGKENCIIGQVRRVVDISYLSSIYAVFSLCLGNRHLPRLSLSTKLKVAL